MSQFKDRMSAADTDAARQAPDLEQRYKGSQVQILSARPYRSHSHHRPGGTRSVVFFSVRSLRPWPVKGRQACPSPKIGRKLLVEAQRASQSNQSDPLAATKLLIQTYRVASSTLLN